MSALRSGACPKDKGRMGRNCFKTTIQRPNLPAAETDNSCPKVFIFHSDMKGKLKVVELDICCAFKSSILAYPLSFYCHNLFHKCMVLLGKPIQP